MSLVVHENLNFALLHHTNARVCRSEIDTDNCVADQLAIGDPREELCPERTYQCHSFPVMGPVLVRVLSGEGRGEKTKGKGKEELRGLRKTKIYCLAP